MLQQRSAAIYQVTSSRRKFPQQRMMHSAYNKSARTFKQSCKGCGLKITARAVASSDGKLSGRYHKRCFVCSTCQSPFQTAEFYVFNDQPYCSQHYYQLNGSICTICKQGIEGLCFQAIEGNGNFSQCRQLFHPTCITSATRRTINWRVNSTKLVSLPENLRVGGNSSFLTRPRHPLSSSPFEHPRSGEHTSTRRP